MIKHHPDMQLLTDFAAGSLPFGQALCISVHHELCPDCQRHVRSLNELGGEMLEQLSPVDIDDDLFSGIMASITEDMAADNGGPASTNPVSAFRFSSGTAESSPDPVPAALAKLLPGGLNAVDWNRATAALSTSLIRVGDEANQVSLIKMKAGGRIDRHSHEGDELTVVLKGVFSDERGTYQVGDVIRCSVDDKPQPIAPQIEDCICLAAQDGPIRFAGLKGMLLNPLVEFSPG